MAHDGSLASQLEDWIVARLKSLTYSGPLFEPESVTPWDGTEKESVEDFSNEFMAGRRDTAAAVYFLEDAIQPLEAGKIEVVGTYVILTATRNERPGEGRRGTAARAGTNRIRDLVRYGLHDQRPTVAGDLINDAVYCVDRLEWAGSAIVLARKTVTIQRHLVLAHEMPLTE
ncbi:MAG: hypothetical protein J5J06_05610 [Phycisphaerae bacterium]|nr:hypothetical protein [Phycisphaerae bacterium]